MFDGVRARVATHVAANATAYRGGAWLAIALTIIAAFEGLSTRPYRDSVGVLTVCYGATAADQVDLARTYTVEECKAMLAADLPKYDAEVRRCIKVELPPHREAALVSLAYNVGPPAVCRSSVVRDLNAGRIQQACDDFLKFDRAGGRVLPGLLRRRQAERKLCLMDN